MKSVKGLKYLQIDPSRALKKIDPAVFKKAIEEYKADVKANPEAYKEMLDYNGE